MARLTLPKGGLKRADKQTKREKTKTSMFPHAVSGRSQPEVHIRALRCRLFARRQMLVSFLKTALAFPVQIFSLH